MKPVVGVMPLWDDEKDSIWMLPGYLEGIMDSGGLPVIFPLAEDEEDLEQLVRSCDGFLFTGGHDVSPEMYQESPLEGLVDTCPRRDRMEAVILRKALERDLPVLGICRGLQLINVCLGGGLVQDLPTQHVPGTEHHQTPPYDRPVHDVTIPEATPLRDCLGCDRLSVNSYHHQAVRKLAPALQAMAFSPDGLVEAVYMPGKRFLWAVQWHPEYSFRRDTGSRRIFRAFVRSMM